MCACASLSSCHFKTKRTPGVAGLRIGRQRTNWLVGASLFEVRHPLDVFFEAPPHPGQPDVEPILSLRCIGPKRGVGRIYLPESVDEGAPRNGEREPQQVEPSRDDIAASRVDMAPDLSVVSRCCALVGNPNGTIAYPASPFFHESKAKPETVSSDQLPMDRIVPEAVLRERR